jgi:hypothetical protein
MKDYLRWFGLLAALQPAPVHAQPTAHEHHAKPSPPAGENK